LAPEAIPGLFFVYGVEIKIIRNGYLKTSQKYFEEGIDGVLDVYIMRTSLQRSGFGGAGREKVVVKFERC